ncbi:MAG: hypothetical protein LBC03_02795 [Nitrososphaerota archaeon]|jgi:glycosyltransferase involved in cell wall biosynthesis|nr:hypothetical protein [Nitrososphaerota archaeon]
MKTVILVPVFNCGKTLPTFFSFLYKLTPQPNLFVFAENNSNDNTLKVLKGFKKPHKIIRVWFRDDAAINSESRYVPIAHIRQLLLTFARNYDPDFAIFIDSDIYPHSKDLIDRLTLWGTDIIGGAYLRLFPEGLFIASKWLTQDDHIRMIKNINTNLSEPHVTSAGCLCLSRKIIQDKRLNFYPLLEQASEDFGYCIKARELGYRIYLDGDLKLQHIIPQKTPKKPWVFDEQIGRCTPFYYNSV